MKMGECLVAGTADASFHVSVYRVHCDFACIFAKGTVTGCMYLCPDPQESLNQYWIPDAG